MITDHRKQTKEISYLKARSRSFRYAFNGIHRLFKEPNARIHLCFAILALTASILLGINATQWTLIILCIAGVLSAEAVNTAIENLADKISPEYSPLIKAAKDTAAAAVLILAIASVIIGLIIFIPGIIQLINV